VQTNLATKSATKTPSAKVTAAPANTENTSRDKQVLLITGDTGYSLLSMNVGVLLIANGVFFAIVLRRKHRAE
jgi:hypothetical protein